MKVWKHFKTINHHKWLVMKYCFRVGLYKQGFLHDLSKYSLTEFLVGAKYYQGDQSPNNIERKTNGYSLAWLHHKGRNKHHLEYWIDYGTKRGEPMTGMKMPVKFVVEMFCDRIAASKNYNKDKYQDSDPLIYYNVSKGAYILHPSTRELLEKLLTMLSVRGEDNTFYYINKIVLKRGYDCLNDKD
ncbi:MAG: DUF5662 family protein [Anaerocolumna sp.]